MTIDFIIKIRDSTEALLSVLLSCLWTERERECDCEGVSSPDSILSNDATDAIAFPFAFARWADECDRWVSVVPRAV